MLCDKTYNTINFVYKFMSFITLKWLIPLLYKDILIDIISLVGKYRDDSGKKNS